jgi:hypothetical protein
MNTPPRRIRCLTPYLVSGRRIKLHEKEESTVPQQKQKEAEPSKAPVLDEQAK